MLAYREMSDEDLFTTQWVKVDLPPEEFPGYKGERIVCETCGEGINSGGKSARRQSSLPQLCGRKLLQAPRPETLPVACSYA